MKSRTPVSARPTEITRLRSTTLAFRSVSRLDICDFPTITSIALEGCLVVLLERRILRILAQIAIAYRKDVQLSTHKTTKRVFRYADDGFATHVEAGVYEYRTAGVTLEFGQ